MVEYFVLILITWTSWCIINRLLDCMVLYGLALALGSRSQAPSFRQRQDSSIQSHNLFIIHPLVQVIKIIIHLDVLSIESTPFVPRYDTIE